jgi:hypothetical protein
MLIMDMAPTAGLKPHHICYFTVGVWAVLEVGPRVWAACEARFVSRDKDQDDGAYEIVALPGGEKRKKMA